MEHTVPELQRCNLTGVVLELLALGLNDILSFDFMDPPSKEALVDALEQLYLLGAVQQEGGLQLTPLGKQMAHYPLEPHLSKAILASQVTHSWVWAGLVVWVECIAGSGVRLPNS